MLFFARAREVVGARRAETPPGTVAEVLDELVRRHGESLAEMLPTCTIVVDGEVVPRDEFATRSAGVELAVLPPVSGGAVGADAPDDRGAHVEDDGPIRLAVLTVSDRASAGDYSDLTGPALVERAAEMFDARLVEAAVVADDADEIAKALRRWCDGGDIDLVLTNGGTGLSPRDITPEVTRSLLDAEAPGFGELMRAEGRAHTPLAALSRQTAGRRGTTLILNLPGSVRAATESLDAVAAILPHAVATVRSQP